MALFGKLFGGPNIEKLEGKNNIKGLIKALNDRSENTRIQAIDSLCRIGNGEEIKPFISLLYDENMIIRRKSANALDERGWKPSNEWDHVAFLIGRKNIEKLRKIRLLDLLELSEENLHLPEIPFGIDLSSFITATLWEIGQKDVSTFLDILKDHNKGFSRVLAAFTLGVIGDSMCSEPLSNIFKDKNEDTLLRKVVPIALQCYGLKNEEGVGSLFNILIDSSSDNDMRISSTRILATIGLPSLNLLIKGLENTLAEARAFSAMAIISIGDPDTVKLIKKLKNDENENVREIAELFSQVIESPNLDSYLSLMNMDHDSFKLAAVNALGNIGDIKAIDVLVDATKSPNENIRTDAFFALGKMIDNPDVKEFFIKSIFDKRSDASIGSCMILLRSNISILNEL